VPTVRPPSGSGPVDSAASPAAPRSPAWVIPTVIAACLAVIAVLSFGAWRLLSGPSEAPPPPPVAAETTPAVAPAASAGTDSAVAPAPSDTAASPTAVADAGSVPGAVDPNALAPATATEGGAVAGSADPAAQPPADAAAPIAEMPALADASQVLGAQPPPTETTSTALESPGQVLPVTPPPAAEAPPVAATTTPAASEAAPVVASADTVKTVDVTGSSQRRDSETSSRPRESASSARSRRDAKPAAATIGNVKLSIQPWGEVWINGSLRGVSPPLRFLQLEPGTYNVELRNPGLQSMRRQLTVTAGQPTSIEHRFQPAGSGAAQ
jgi:hypothetical protein